MKNSILFIAVVLTCCAYPSSSAHAGSELIQIALPANGISDDAVFNVSYWDTKDFDDRNYQFIIGIDGNGVLLDVTVGISQQDAFVLAPDGSELTQVVSSGGDNQTVSNGFVRTYGDWEFEWYEVGPGANSWLNGRLKQAKNRQFNLSFRFEYWRDTRAGVITVGKVNNCSLQYYPREKSAVGYAGQLAACRLKKADRVAFSYAVDAKRASGGRIDLINAPNLSPPNLAISYFTGERPPRDGLNGRYKAIGTLRYDFDVVGGSNAISLLNITPEGEDNATIQFRGLTGAMPTGVRVVFDGQLVADPEADAP